MLTTALVPLRSPGRGKTRLASALSPTARASLAGAMLADVATALGAARIDELVVVAGGPAGAAAAAALGLDVLVDPPGVADLDAAIGAACARLGRRTTLLVVAADLPRLTAPDVEAVLAPHTDVVVATTVDGGTGVLVRRPADVIPTAYGPGSGRRHVRLARSVGASTAVVDRPGTSLDVDTLADLRRLRHAPVGAATGRLLATWDGPDAIGSRTPTGTTTAAG
jgi:2-phospho-L-lactate/phosphoenolpyruvate guanylyltransferase